jgi:hypothetical protein
MGGERLQAVISRIKEGCLITPTCWLWLGCLDDRGYGRVKVKGRSARTHIEAFTAVRGAPPKGAVLDHLCRVRHCCNPAHLEPISPLENTRRGESPSAQRRRQTHCIRGHELAGDNVYERKDRPGMRECRACYRELQRARRAARKNDQAQ